MTLGKITIIIYNMKEQICENCKYFNGGCQNSKLTRREKTLRRSKNKCEYWKEDTQELEGGKSLKASLLDIAIQLENLIFSLEDDEE